MRVCNFRSPCKNRFGLGHSLRRGVAAVEFALLAPVIVLLLAGLWEVGRIVETQQILSQAVREGGRQSSAGLKTVAQVKSDVTNYLTRAGVSTAGLTIDVTNATASSRSDPTAAEQLDRFTLKATLPYSSIKWSIMARVTTIADVVATTEWASMRDLPVTVAMDLPVD